MKSIRNEYTGEINIKTNIILNVFVYSSCSPGLDLDDFFKDEPITFLSGWGGGLVRTECRLCVLMYTGHI